MNSPIETAIFQELSHMSPDQQQHVLDFVKNLASETPALPKGVPGKDLLDLVGSISKEDLALMKEAIEEGCGQVDPSEW